MVSARRISFLFLSAVLLAQSPAFDAFEVATIKPALADLPGRYIRMQSAHQLEVRNQTVRRLVSAAFNVSPQAISGGPAWADSDRFQILAKTPGDDRPNHDQQMAMLRRLLIDRFQLAFHRERKALPI